MNKDQAMPELNNTPEHKLAEAIQAQCDQWRQDGVASWHAVDLISLIQKHWNTRPKSEDSKHPRGSELTDLADKLYRAQEACNEVAAHGACSCGDGSETCAFCLCFEVAEGFVPRESDSAMSQPKGQENE
jgi:hypothetical protein